MPKLYFTSKAQVGSFKPQLLCFESMESSIPPASVVEEDDNTIQVDGVPVRVEDYLEMLDGSESARDDAIQQIISARRRKGVIPQKLSEGDLDLNTAIQQVLNSRRRAGDTPSEGDLN
ncbi:hypothetical protein JW758_04990 [Candidatus Peregrinibacteria bacterium]|nr:hypothetical protein [Candidatus Peregrinibacteria bacterium]